MPQAAVGQQSQIPPSVSALVVKTEPPTSILKAGLVNNHNNNITNQQQQQQQQQVSPPEPVAPPPPERGSSFAVMSMRTKESTKRVSFDTSTASPQPPTTLQLEENIREDPNVFCSFSVDSINANFYFTELHSSS